MNSTNTEILQHPVNIDTLQIGGGNLVVFAGLCAVEDEDTLLDLDRAVKSCGVSRRLNYFYLPTANINCASQASSPST